MSSLHDISLWWMNTSEQIKNRKTKGTKNTNSSCSAWYSSILIISVLLESRETNDFLALMHKKQANACDKESAAFVKQIVLFKRLSSSSLFRYGVWVNVVILLLSK